MLVREIKGLTNEELFNLIVNATANNRMTLLNKLEKEFLRRLNKENLKWWKALYVTPHIW